MILLHPEYVVDAKKQPKAVLLPMSEWKQVMNDLEELADIRAYDEAKSAADERIPFELAVQEIQAGYDRWSIR